MTHLSKTPNVLLVGNFLSGQIGNHCVCEELAANLKSANLQVITTSTKKARIPRLLDMVSTIFRKRRDYDIANVDVYSGLAFGLAEASCWALRLAGKPFVLSLHGGNLPNFSKRWPQRVRRLLAGAQAVTTPSSYLQEQMGDYRRDIKLIPNPLSLDNYSFEKRCPARPRLVWIRSFHQIYNPSLAVRVVAELVPDYPDLQLTMVGPDKGDDSFQQAQQTARDLNVIDRIEFTGGVPKEDIPRYLDAGDIFINTTNIDNTPVSVLEAMASGLCVVSTNVGGIPHLITDRNNGMMVAPDDVTAMAQAVSEILRDQEFAGRLSENSRKYTDQLDWRTILPRWVELFSELHSET